MTKAMNEAERAARARAPQRCPRCYSPIMDPVVDGDEVNFLCRSCGRCWHIELAHISRVNPRTCGGCPHKAACLARED